MKRTPLITQSPNAKTYQNTFPLAALVEESWIGCVGAAVVAVWLGQQTEYRES